MWPSSGRGFNKFSLHQNFQKLGDVLSVQNVEMNQIALFLEEGLQFTMTSVVDSTINIATLRGLKGLLKIQ